MNNSFSVSYSSDQAFGQVSWRCPSNIALIKYWGKRDKQLPANPSLSFTLSECVTETTIEFEYIDADISPVISFTINGQPNPKFQARIASYIEERSIDIPEISHLRMQIHSKNTFPHSAGIASSASAFGALALCLCSIEEKMNGSVNNSADFFRKASSIARLGSGSACRSVYGGYTIWGESEFNTGFSNQYAVAIPFEIHPDFMHMQDTILIVSGDVKPLSSSAGHALMNNHPFAAGRYNQAQENIQSLVTSLRTGDMERFGTVVEKEALTLHALIMSSGTILLKPATLSIIEKIIQFRNETKIPVCYTIDAGPNIHFLYAANYKDKVLPFIESELKPLCCDNQIIMDFIGNGPVRLI